MSLETPSLDAIVQVRTPDGRVIDIVDWTDMPLYSSADFQSGFVQEETDFFQYVVGREVPGIGNGASTAVKRTATDIDTNMAVAGELTTNEEMLVYAIKPEIYMFTTTTTNNFTTRSITADGDDGTEPIGFPGASPECLNVLNQQTLLRLEISEKTKAEAGFGYFNAGFGPFIGTTIVPGTADSFKGTAVNGLPSQGAVRSFVIGHHIGGQEKFRVSLVNPQGTAVNFSVGELVTSDVRLAPADVMMTIRVNLDGLYKRPTA